ncbi:MAG: PASTA domain-containing protein [Candidatus Riflebacteria bacterium]|nr:PASTA domain-containing protein [Candidatus Riflebacteria bacterium]
MAKKESCLLILLKMTLMITMLVAFVIAGFFYVKDFLNEYFNRGETIEVPDFRGKHLVDVFKEKPPDLLIEKRDEKCDPRFNKDHVIAQYPEPGTRVKRNKKILLTISLGGKQVTVPDLTGKSTRETALLLLNAQLKEGNRAYIFSAKTPKDRIIAQSPLPFSNQAISQGVDVLVSLGTPAAKNFLPSLIGKSLDEAKTILADFSVKIGKQLYKKDTVYEPNRVLSTKPSPYEMITEGATVDLLLSSQTSQSSVEEIRKFSSFVEVSAVTPPGDAFVKQQPAEPLAKVVSEKPVEKIQEKPQEKAPEKIDPPKIILPEEKPEEESPVAKPVSDGNQASSFLTFTMPDGFMAKEVKFLLVSPTGRKEVYSNTHKPLDQIKVQVPKVPDGKVQVYINNILVEELSQ